MTGTADTEAFEFAEIYEPGSHGRSRPTVRCVRNDRSDQVYLNRAEQVQGGARRHPGCTSAASRCWWAPPRSRRRRSCPDCSRKAGVPHNVLNAKQHEREAHDRRRGRPSGRGHHRHQHGRPRHRHPAGWQCRAESDRGAGRRTPMRSRARIEAEWQKRHEAGAWRPAACTSSGTERHESRRIDNQLRGRSGRQGDPGRPASTCRWKTT